LGNERRRLKVGAVVSSRATSHSLSLYEKALLRRIELQRDPSLASVVDAIGGARLTEEQRERLREALAAELCASGVNPSGEPNPRGYQIEKLIDKLGHL